MLRTSAVPAHTLVVQLLENYTFLSVSRMEALKVGSKGLKQGWRQGRARGAIAPVGAC